MRVLDQVGSQMNISSTEGLRTDLQVHQEGCFSNQQQVYQGGLKVPGSVLTFIINLSYFQSLETQVCSPARVNKL